MAWFPAITAECIACPYASSCGVALDRLEKEADRGGWSDEFRRKNWKWITGEVYPKRPSFSKALLDND